MFIFWKFDLEYTRKSTGDRREKFGDSINCSLKLKIKITYLCFHVAHKIAENPSQDNDGCCLATDNHDTYCPREHYALDRYISAFCMLKKQNSFSGKP